MANKSLVSAISVSVVSAGALIGLMLTSALRPPPAHAPDKNGPGVVRVSVIDGSAVVQRGDSDVQANAVRNAPMLPGDYFSTGKTSRAELQFDGYTAVRLGGNAQARIVSNDPNNRRVQLADGTLEVGMVRGGQSMEIDTPSVTVRAAQAGDFRISIAADGSSWVTARRGGADVLTPQRTYNLGTGTTLVARGSASTPSISYTPDIAFDSFDDFNAERDKTMIAALSANPNLNPSIAGYDNLNAYGQWQAVAGYGQSWVPNEPAGWVPYRNGSWAWEGGYGWTWVGSEPWGWVPYHYGNWYYCDCGHSGWAWLPPSSTKSPTWSPALVGFFGFDVASTGGYNNCGGNYGYAPSNAEGPSGPSGNGAPEAAPYSSSPAAPYNAAPPNAAAPAPYGEGGPGPETPYGYGSPQAPSGYPYPYVGWVPIAPYEPYYSWYPGWSWIGVGWAPFYGGYGYGFGRSVVNITNIRNVTRIYRNFRHGGASATRTRNFRHGTVSGHTVAVTPRDIGRRIGTVHGELPVKPTRANLAFSRGTVHAPVKFSKAFNSPRFALDRTLAARTSFAQQRKDATGAVRAARSGQISHANVREARTNMRMAHAVPVSHASASEPRTNASMARGTLPEAHAPVSRQNEGMSRENEGMSRQNEGMSRQNEGMSRQYEATRRENAPITRENAAPVNRENTAPAMRGENTPEMRQGAEMRQDGGVREGAETPRQTEPTRGQFGPSTTWDRFNQARGDARSGEFQAGSQGAGAGRDMRGGEASSNPAARDERGAPDSWGRFSNSRGESYGNARNPYAERESTPSYDRGVPSYARGSSGSGYSRESYPSYSRGSYDSPYSRQSYPSYQRQSYPSYQRQSYPSYQRQSYPSYSHGSYGSGPSYSRGNWSPPRSSGGGGGGGGGGGERRGGGGRPPHGG